MIRLANVQRFRGNWIIIQPVPAALQAEGGTGLNGMVYDVEIARGDMAAVIALPRVTSIGHPVMRDDLNQRAS